MSFNDPFDCAIVKGEKFKEFFLETKKILCLTSEFDNLLMWSHYANSHTGICIEYTPFTTVEIEYLRRQKVFGNSPVDRLLITQNARRVKYKSKKEIDEYLDSLPESDLEYMKLHEQSVSDGTADLFYSKISEALTIKHESWSYENEYRIIHDGNNRNFHPGKTTKIFLGAKMSPQDKRTISILIDKNIEIVCMDFSSNKYELIQRPLNPEQDYNGLGLRLSP